MGGLIPNGVPLVEQFKQEHGIPRRLATPSLQSSLTGCLGAFVFVAKIPDSLASLCNCGAQLVPRHVHQAGLNVLAFLLHRHPPQATRKRQCAVLNDCVVHLARQPASLLQHCLEAGPHMAHAILIHRIDQQQNQNKASRTEPPRPVKERALQYFYRSFRNSFGIAYLKCSHPENVLPRRQIGVVSSARGCGRAKILIEAGKHITKAEPVLGSQLNRLECELQSAIGRLQDDGVQS